MSGPTFPELATDEVYSVLRRGSGVTGDGTTYDTDALNAFIAASPVGATILFPANHTYLVSGMITYLPNRAYVGGGWALGGKAVIKQANGANIVASGGPVAGLLAPQGWRANASTCDGPVLISNLAFDGNVANNGTSTASGVVMMNFWSRVEKCNFTNMPLHGIHLTDTGEDGSTVISNTASENKLVANKIYSVGGHGISQVSAGGNANLDGFAVDNLISSTGLGGVNLARGAGWLVAGNHFYGIATTAIGASNCYATRITGNYIEDFGGANAASAYYQGIGTTVLNGRGLVISGNQIACAEPAANTSTYQYISCTSGSSQTTARAVITGNLISGAGTGQGFGLVLQNGSGGAVLTADAADNHTNNVNTNSYISTGVIVENRHAGRPRYTDTRAPTAAAQAANGGSPPSATIPGGNDFHGQVSFGSGTSPTTGNQVVVTFNTAFSATPTIVLSAATAAAAGCDPYLASTSTTSFTLAFGVAPAASQSAGTYKVNWWAAI